MNDTLDRILPEPPALNSGLITMPADEYHADPCEVPSLSSSIARMMLGNSPAHARIAHPKLNPNFQQSSDDKFDLGTVAHELLLEGDTNVCVIEADDWRKKETQEQKAAAREAGKTPLLAKDWVRVEAMMVAARRQLDDVDADPAPLTEGLPEQTLIWNDGEAVCRARFDWIHHDLSAVDDLKTTSASADPAKWQRTMFQIGADFQAAFYLRGLRKALGVEPVWRFVVQENYPPYALSVVTLSPDVLAHAARRVDEAIELWERCLRSNHWPSYTRATTTIELPSWMQTGAEPVSAGRSFGDEAPF